MNVVVASSEVVNDRFCVAERCLGVVVPDDRDPPTAVAARPPSRRPALDTSEVAPPCHSAAVLDVATDPRRHLLDDGPNVVYVNIAPGDGFVCELVADIEGLLDRPTAHLGRAVLGDGADMKRAGWPGGCSQASTELMLVRHALRIAKTNRVDLDDVVHPQLPTCCGLHLADLREERLLGVLVRRWDLG